MKYRSFIREPSQSEKFLHSWSSTSEHDDHLATRQRLSRLARKLFIPYPWPVPPADGQEAWENQRIPSGYTYLAQFVAHDCVNSSIPTPALRFRGPLSNNQRAAALRLETLYGAGPDGCAHALTQADRAELRPSKLRLGRMRLERGGGGQCPFRDIPRAHAIATTGADEGLGGVLIPDDRNDNNVIVSQTTVLFTLLHNAIVDLLHENSRARKHNQLWPGYYLGLYSAAKSLCIEAYHRIVRDDLLNRLLHPAVFEHYARAAPRFLDGRPLDSIPVEFVVALRFGHAMVRPNYRINDLDARREELIDILLTTSRGRPWRLPLDETWIVQWSQFYSIGGSRPNLSRRIGPTFSTDLITGQIFDQIDETGCVGLAYRDLISGAAARPWSVPALIDEIVALEPALVRESRLLADPCYRESELRAWLRDGGEIAGLRDDDVDDLSRDPPLMVFVLFEAAHEMLGEQLGILGSLLVGDVLFKAMAETADAEGATPAFDADLSESVDAVRGRTSAVASMPALAEFVREAGRVDDVPVPFL
jgi:hypothetical protein